MSSVARLQQFVGEVVAGGRTGRPRAVRLGASESGDVARRVPADVGAGDREDLRAVHRPHHLAAAGRNAGLEEQAVEVDAFVAKGSHSLTLITVGGKPATSSTVANDGHASGLRASNASMP